MSWSEKTTIKIGVDIYSKNSRNPDCVLPWKSSFLWRTDVKEEEQTTLEVHNCRLSTLYVNPSNTDTES